MFKNKIIAIFLSLVFFTGCGYKQTTTQERDIAYLKFSKSSSDSYTVVVNDKYKFNLDKCQTVNETGNCIDSVDNNLYEVTSGKIEIKVYDKDNNLILQKEMYLGTSNTKEIVL